MLLLAFVELLSALFSLKLDFFILSFLPADRLLDFSEKSLIDTSRGTGYSLLTCITNFGCYFMFDITFLTKK